RAKAMNTSFLRNFLLFFILLIICFGSLRLLMLEGRKSVDIASDWVRHSQTVISKGQQLNILLERMLADQRGFMLSGKDEFKKGYKTDKTAIAAVIAELTGLADGNTAQTARLKDLQTHFARFAKLLDMKLQQYGLNADSRTEDPAVINS